MFFQYVIVLTLGFVASYTDIRFRKIKNIHLLLAIVLGLIGYLYLITTHRMMFSINLVWNLLVGLGIGMTLYFTDTWGAGDAKLFAVFCLLMPTEKYSKILFFPAIGIFANVFLVSTVGIFILSMKHIIKDRMKILKQIFSLSTVAELGGSFLIIFSLKWVIEIIIGFFIPQAKPFIEILVMFILYRIIRRIFARLKNKYIFILILSVGLVSRFLVFPLDINITMFFSYLKTIFFYMLLFHAFYIIFNVYESNDKEVKTVPFAPIMFLGTILINTNFLNWVMHILRAVRK